jgi:hypothetical protein
MASKIPGVAQGEVVAVVWDSEPKVSAGQFL